MARGRNYGKWVYWMSSICPTQTYSYIHFYHTLCLVKLIYMAYINGSPWSLVSVWVPPKGGYYELNFVPPPARFICWIEAPVLQSGTLFGSKITADIINEDEVIWVIQSSEIGVLIKRGNLDTDTHENAMWRWGQRWGYCFSKPSNTKSAREPLEASREAWTDSSPQLSEGTNPNDAWTSSLQSRETGHFCGLSHQLCSPLLRQC